MIRRINGAPRRRATEMVWSFLYAALACLSLTPWSHVDAQCVVSPPQTAVPSTDVVWIEDEWTNPHGADDPTGPPTTTSWPIDTSQRVSGMTSFPGGYENLFGIRELVAYFPEPPVLSTPRNIVAYILISNCDPLPSAIGVEIQTDQAPLRYYWGEQTLWFEAESGFVRDGDNTIPRPNDDEPGSPVRLGNVPPAGQWVRLEMNTGIFQGAQPSVWSVTLLTGKAASGMPVVWWDHIGHAPAAVPPTITGVTPSLGSTAGGTVVTISGSAFLAGQTIVRFGTTTATATTILSSMELTAVAPPGTGTVDVSVTTSGGTATQSAAFTYVPAPTVATVTPTRGTTAGGQEVTITGSNFLSGQTTVSFGGSSATVTVISATELKAITPAHPPGAVDVQVTTPGGTAVMFAGFRYLDPPAITAFSPVEGTAGDTSVTITGTAFDPDPRANRVTIGGGVASVLSASETQLVVSVPPGAVTARIQIETAGGTATSVTDFVVLAYTAIAISPPSASVEVGETTTLRASGTLTNGTTRLLSTGISWTSANVAVATVTNLGVVRGVAAGETTIGAAFGSLSASASISVRPQPPLPPDPATVAPPLRSAELTSFADANSFLYSDPSPIQTGVAPGTIDPVRISVARGFVRTREGNPLSGVTVRIADHSEYGATLTRADGAFDLALNGGTTSVVTFEKTGYLTAHRTLHARWQDFGNVDGVIMLPLDAEATTIAANAPQVQVARSSIASDDDGQRRATLIIPAGTSAAMTLPDGTTRALGQLTLRMTEYTVGATGPEAMPAPLPPLSGYTYCVELSADEAIQERATTLAFSRPLAFYVENFLGFPVGGVVPSGHYDRQRHAWIPSANGRVLAVVGITAGKADLDISGDGFADGEASLAALGIDAAERERLAALYTTGTSLWRVPVEHFTPYDLNWPLGPMTPSGEDAVPPADAPEWAEEPDDPAACSGSVVRCETQTLGEQLSIAGTPFHLVYESGRVRGRATSRSLRLRLTGSRTPGSVRRIEVRIEIGGIVTERTFTSGTATTDFQWDGRDAYGRLMMGAADAKVRISYIYDAVYQEPRSQRAFAMLSGRNLGVPARLEIPLTTEWSIPLGSLRTESAHLGGWTLTPHHLFDYSRRALLLGSGEQQSADIRDLSKYEMTTVAGVPQCCGDTSGVATRTRLDAPYQVAIGPDGTIYMSEWEEIRRVTPDGRIERIAGTGSSGFSGDGGPATAARINARGTITIGADGSLYFPDWGNRRVRRIRHGIITTVAGNGQSPSSLEPLEEGVPATQARVNPQDVAVAKDGTIYIADQFKYIRRITPDGIIQTVAGAGTQTSDGTAASDFKFREDLEGLALAPDGTIYFGQRGTYGALLRKIGPDGIVRTVIPSGPHCGSGLQPHDGPTSEACLEKIWFLRVGEDGAVYIPDQIGDRVRKVSTDGVVRTIAGSGLSGTFGRAGAAVGERLFQPFGAAVGPDGSVYVSDGAGQIIRKVTPKVPRFIKAGETVIPSADGEELYVFSGSRHLRTLDSLTGAELLRFGYDGEQRLISITDVDGQVTRVERTGGAISAIVAPGGQRTTITVDSSGYLRTVADPAGLTYTLIHDETGLLGELRTPRLLTHHYTYDADGRLQKDLSPDGRSLTLARAGAGDNWNVTTTTTLGHSIVRQRQRYADGSANRASTLPGGLTIQASVASSGATTVLSPEGTLATATPKGDPRFAAGALLVSNQIRYPSGLTLSNTHDRTVVLSNPDDLLSVTRQSDTYTTAGRATTVQYEPPLRLLHVTTPQGRIFRTTTDAARRPLTISLPGLAETQIAYTNGLPTAISMGSRSVSFAYDSKRRLASLTDSLQRTTLFGYDDSDRLISQTIPDGRILRFEYDAAGNLTAVTPPSRPAHRLVFTFGDQVASYHAPEAGAVEYVTRYTYDLDRKLTKITRPDLSAIDVAYDAAGRVSSVSSAGASVGVTWDSVGRADTLTTANGTLSYSYDGDLLTGATLAGEIAGSVGYAYDNGLRLSSETINGDPVPFEWDGDDLLTRAGALNLTRAAETGFLSGTTLGPITDTYVYNEYGEVTAYRAMYNDTPLLLMDYTRDAAGRITAIGSRGFEYDDAGRLTRVTHAGTTISEYEYDTNGNRTEHRYVGGTDTATYDEQDRLLTYGGTVYEFAPSGSLRSRTTAGAATATEYDAFGNLRRVVSAGRIIEYVVDGQNRRVGKKVDGVLVQGWLYSDQLRIAAELDGANNVVSRFVYGSANNIPDYMVKGGVTYRILSDHLGSPLLIVNVADGTVVQSMQFDEFGRVLGDTNPGFQPFGFAGGLYDRDTGLVRFGARDYDPRAGRWTAKDPIGFDGGDTNLYQYVSADPVNFIDPSGLAGGNEFGTLPGTNIRYRIDWNQQPFPNMHIKWPSGKETVVSANGGWKRGMHRGKKVVPAPKGYRKPLRDVVKKFVKKVRKGTKGTPVGCVINLATGLYDDVELEIRAIENGRTGSEQLREELRDAGPYLDTPLGILPNPYHDPIMNPPDA